MRALTLFSAVLFSALFIASNATAEAFDGVTVWTNLKQNELFFFDHHSNTKTDLYQGSSKCRAPVISPDGKRLAWTENNKLWTIKSDGTGRKEICACRTERSKGRTELTWTEKGIMWADIESNIILADPDKQSSRKVFGYNDGTVVPQWFGADADGRTVMVWQHGQGSNGDYDPLIQLNADLTGGSKEWVDIWGHGWFISRDGAHVLINAWSNSRGRNCGAQHRVFIVYETAGNQDVVKCFPSGLPDPQETLTYGLDYCVNDGDLFLFRSRGDDAAGIPARYWIMNWKTEQRWEMDPSDIGEETSYSLEPGTLWEGNLPALYGDGPLISLNKQSLSFVAVNGAFPPQVVEVTNGAGGTLGTVDVQETAEWLTTEVSGNAPQVITNTVDASGLAAGAYTAAVTVSGGGAANEAIYEVTLNVGSDVAAPTGLKVHLSQDADSVRLSWVDNADTETGYAIERSVEGGTWSTVGETAADEVSFGDQVAGEGEHSYRVRALADPHPSGYSNTATLLVTFEPSLRITSPAADTPLEPGREIVIAWDAVNVGLIALEYSTDEGKTYEPITVAGGLPDTDPRWADYAWVLPEGAQSIMIRIYEYGNETVEDVSAGLPVSISRPAGLSSRSSPPMLRSPRGIVGKEPSSLIQHGAVTVYSAHGRRVELSTYRNPHGIERRIWRCYIIGR